MKNLILTLNTDEIVVEFGSSLELFKRRYPELKFDEFEDQGSTLKNFLISEQNGLEVLFNDGALSAVFLYVYDADDDYSRFRGWDSELGRDFWGEPSLSRFEKVCGGKNFALKETKSGQTTRYECKNLGTVYTKSAVVESVYFGHKPLESFRG